MTAEGERVLTLYVPGRDSSLREKVWAGSGLVGSEMEDTGQIRVDFEGDDEVYPTFLDRVRRAAERHLWQGTHREGYPTRACAYADPDELVEVGRYRSAESSIELTKPDALAEWLGVEDLVEIRLD